MEQPVVRIEFGGCNEEAPNRGVNLLFRILSTKSLCFCRRHSCTLWYASSRFSTMYTHTLSAFGYHDRLSFPASRPRLALASGVSSSSWPAMRSWENASDTWLSARLCIEGGSVGPRCFAESGARVPISTRLLRRLGIYSRWLVAAQRELPDSGKCENHRMGFT